MDGRPSRTLALGKQRTVTEQDCECNGMFTLDTDTVGMKGLIALTVILVTSLWTWILGIRMRRRIRRALGRDVENESELTSLNTWIKVEDEEERQRGGKLF